MPENYQLRSATERDSPAIKKLVTQARLNPTQLKWQHFVVATDFDGAVIGCGQIKTHQDGSHELASLVVDLDFRGLGIARGLIEHLMGIHEGDLYLMCRSNLGGFYEKFGFEGIGESHMPPYFRRIARLVSIAEILRKEGETLLVMKRCRGDSYPKGTV
jgi:N-acetylglutamate synthase-like GNAT family acetyltransferase